MESQISYDMNGENDVNHCCCRFFPCVNLIFFSGLLKMWSYFLSLRVQYCWPRPMDQFKIFFSTCFSKMQICVLPL